MKRVIINIILISFLAFNCIARNVTVNADQEPAAVVFRAIVEQTGKNFVYSSDILEGLKVTVHAERKPLKNVLRDMFRDTDIEFKIKGNNIILRRSNIRRPENPARIPHTQPEVIYIASLPEVTMLDEVVVVSRLEAPAVEAVEIGATKVTAQQVRDTPSLFGEPDVIKSLQKQPGVAQGDEGMAGMYVHGGNADENLYMLDNVPLYQINHFAGLFSAFNSDIIRYIDFFKSSFPAKYDGRLSSFMDVRSRNGDTLGYHGSARLGLTSGAFNISGPIGSRTTWLAAIRRSWYDVLTIPVLALANSGQDEKVRFHYYFMDLNAKVTHRFSDDMSGFASVYFGDDMLKTGSKDSDPGSSDFSGWTEDNKYDFHWGNLVVQTGLNCRFSSKISAEFTAAYTRFFSSMKHNDTNTSFSNGTSVSVSQEISRTNNNINDWIFRGDFDWQPFYGSRVRFGAGYIRHAFLPARTSHSYIYNDTRLDTRDSTFSYGADEINAYVENDWRISGKVRANVGIHASLFSIDSHVKHGLSPRISINWHLAEDWSIKGAYSRTVQYVHKLEQSYLSMPTDQWLPVTGSFKPQSADKVAAGLYWQTASGMVAVSVEGYWKWMHNLIDYGDEYYLKPPLEMWDSRLVSGRGSAKGVDVKIEKKYGKVTGYLTYSLAWSDRTFAGKNGGRTFPARFDNRHTINIVVNWKINDNVQLNAAWTGHSGNRFTFMPQVWDDPGFHTIYAGSVTPLRTSVNNYQLPFYHRLDLSCTVTNSRGYWTFGLYNAYNHLNTVAIRRAHKEVVVPTPDGVAIESKPVFQKVRFLPLIPSISYTWLF